MKFKDKIVYMVRKTLYMVRAPRYRLTLAEVIEACEGTRTYVFEKPDRLSWVPGASTHLVFDDGIGRMRLDLPLTRHMSFQTRPEEGKVGFTTKIPGSRSVFKQRLESLVPGDSMTILGVHNHMSLQREDRPVLMISMGVGLATMRPMMLAYGANQTGIPQVTSIHVDRSEPNLYEADLRAADIPNLKLIYLKSRENLAEQVEEAVASKPICYVVGSEPFIKGVIGLLKTYGVENEAIHIDKPEVLRKNYGLV